MRTTCVLAILFCQLSGCASFHSYKGTWTGDTVPCVLYDIETNACKCVIFSLDPLKTGSTGTPWKAAILVDLSGRPYYSDTLEYRHISVTGVLHFERPTDATSGLPLIRMCRPDSEVGGFVVVKIRRESILDLGPSVKPRDELDKLCVPTPKSYYIKLPSGR